MKPYYQDDYATIYHGDCREILPKIGRVDFLFADPQYNVGFGYANNGDSNKGYASSAKEWFGLFDETCVAITPGMDNVMLWPQPRWIIAWLKLNAMGANRLSGPATVSRNLWEPILWYGKYPPNQITRDLIYAEIGVGFNEHPCPKPVKLLSQLLAAGTRSNEIVLDPFMGSGTTLVAAKERQQKAIGIEIEEKYCETAAKRLAQEVLPFGRPVPKACLSTVQSEFIT